MSELDRYSDAEHAAALKRIQADMDSNGCARTLYVLVDAAGTGMVQCTTLDNAIEHFRRGVRTCPGRYARVEAWRWDDRADFDIWTPHEREPVEVRP